MLQFTRVDSIETTERGLEAALHGERLRIEPVRDDVVRIKLSRGGVFDDTPTHAVIADGTAEFTVEGNQLRTAALTVTLREDPFGIDVHRADGTAVLESTRAYATLNDAFEVRRRAAVRRRDLRPGGEGRTRQPARPPYTLWNTDILNPTAAAEFGGNGDDIEFDPYYVAIPFFYHHTKDGHMAGSFIDNGYRAAYDFGEELAIRFEGGQYTEYVFAGPRMPDILEAYTWLTGRAAKPPLWALGYHQCRWFDYTQDAVEALGAQHREHGLPCDALWLDIDYMDGYRVFTWNTERFPDAPGMLQRLDEQGFKVDHDHRPGREVRARLRGLRPGGRARRAVPHRGRRHLHRPGLAGRHRVPRLRHRGGPRVVGRAERRARAVRPGRHLERHERAGHGRDPARADALRPRPRLPRALPQPVRAADGDGHGRRPAQRRCRRSARSCSRAPASPASSATPRTGWATTSRAGTTCG